MFVSGVYQVLTPMPMAFTSLGHLVLIAPLLVIAFLLYPFAVSGSNHFAPVPPFLYGGYAILWSTCRIRTPPFLQGSPPVSTHSMSSSHRYMLFPALESTSTSMNSSNGVPFQPFDVGIRMQSG